LAFQNLTGAFKGYLDGLDLTKPKDLAKVLQGVVDVITGLIDVTSGMVKQFEPFVDSIVEFFRAVANGDSETKESAGQLMALAMAAEKLGAALVAMLLYIDKYSMSIESITNVVTGFLQAIFNIAQLIGSSIQGIFVVLEGVILTFVDKMTFGLLSKFSPTFKALLETVTESGKGVSDAIDRDVEDLSRAFDKIGEGFSGVKSKATEAAEAVDKIPAQKETLVTADTWKALEDVGKFAIELTKVPEEKTTKVTTTADTQAVETVRNEIVTLPDGTVEIQVLFDESKLQAAKAAVGSLPGEKKIDVSIETARIRADADTIQKAVEWRAKIDIASIEAGTERIKSMFGSIDKGIESTGSLMSSMFSALTQQSPYQYFIKTMIEEEAERRQKTFDLQKELINNQLKLLETKAKALERATT